MPEGPTLAELGETELIRRLGAFAPRGQFGDDAALLGPALLGPNSGGDLQLVVNTDVLVEDVHFSEATMGARDVGWRAAAIPGGTSRWTRAAPTTIFITEAPCR